MGLINEIADNSYAKLLHLYYYPYYLKIGRPDFKILDQFKKIQYLSEDEIYELKFAKIKRILWFASKYVPYYQNLFSKSKINIQNIKDVTDFTERVPILTKADIQQNYPKLIATKIAYPPTIHNSTGGSTGKPMNFLQDRYSLAHSSAGNLLNLTMCGWKRWEKIAHLWGSSRDTEKRSGSSIEARLKNKIFLDSFNMDEEKIFEYYQKLKKYKPKLIIGYANSLFLFAQFLQKYNLFFEDMDFTIQSSAETLYPVMRKTIEEKFRTKVFNSYGSREISAIAHECNFHSGMHINEVLNHLEIVKLQNSVNYGKILLTNFTNFAFPLIRYQNEDVGELLENNSCRCGRKFKKLKKLHGRTSDFIQTPSGKIIHGEFFSHLLYSQKIIAEFQVIQDTIEQIEIKYVLASNKENLIKTAQMLANMVDKIHHHCGKSLNISLNQVDRIPLLKSGKNKFIISKIKIF